MLFTKYCFPLWFYSVIEKMGKRKKEDDTFLRKKTKEKSKQCDHHDICSWKRDSFFSKLEIRRGIV